MNKQHFFSIGEVSKLFNLSVSSLRHYENIGLIIPEYIDSNSGYRYYGAKQFETLNTIRYLRTLDMPLAEISDFLNNRDVERIEEKLLIQKQAVIKKRKELKRIERKIENRLQTIENAKKSVFDSVQLIRKSSCRMVWINSPLKIRNYLDMEAPMRKFDQKQTEAVIFLGKVGVSIEQKNLQLSHFDCYDGIFLILDEEDNFYGEITEIPESLCATVCFHGSHPEAPAQYKKLMSYINEHELEICGFSREITMIDYALTDDLSKFVTEINIPVKHK